MPGSLKITNIQFKAGKSNGQPPLTIIPNNILILVGPNNSGKSLALREIENFCNGSDFVPQIINAIDYDFPNSLANTQVLLSAFQIPNPIGPVTPPGNIWINLFSMQAGPIQQQIQQQIDIQSLSNSIINNGNTNANRNHLVRYFTIRLDGKTRFFLAEPKPSGDLLLQPQNHLWKLFQDDAAREQVRILTQDAFGLHFVIDPTAMTQFRIRMSSRAPANKAEEQGLDLVSRTFHSAASHISSLSDGVQAFVGLTSALLSLPHKILLVDEPEAFLHPPLARRLGGTLARLAQSRDASLITATHSADFVMGCLETVANTIVVRFTYENNVATARMLSAVDLQQMIKDPLLRSTGTLRALFHRAAIVTESDADRSFYDEINNRLLQANRGIKDALFINAQNKQTIRRIIRPLRQIGVPAAAIVDLDIIRIAGEFAPLLADCQVPAIARAGLEIERAWLLGQIQAAPVAAGIDPLKNGGINLLVSADLIRARTFLSNLNLYGIFPIPSGEIETWLTAVGAVGHGPNWLIDMFSKIGQTPGDLQYLVPVVGDVWDFIDQINVWIQNPNRLGT